MFGKIRKALFARKRHVHPLVAWAAIVSAAIVFTVAPTLIFAQTVVGGGGNVNAAPPEPQVSSCRQSCYDIFDFCSKSAGDDQAKQQCVDAAKTCVDKCPAPAPQGDRGEGGDKPKPQVSVCRQTCYGTYNSCVQSAGDDRAAVDQCGTAAKQCVNQCPPVTENGADRTMPQKPRLSACRQACYDAYGTCKTAAGSDAAAAAQCGATGMDCVSKCPAEAPKNDQGKGSGASSCMRACYDARTACVKAAEGDHAASEQCTATAKGCASACAPAAGAAGATDRTTARQAYLDALKSARQAYQDALKKAQTDYQSAIKQAQSDYAASKSLTN